MYYRLYGEPEYNFITLDGFTINNQFVKSLHYGFIPKDLINQNTLYQVYFEAENLVGLKTQIKNNSEDFILSTDYNAEYSSDYKLPYSLPAGSIFENELSLSNNSKDIILRTNLSPKVSSIYTFNNDQFVLVDSLEERIVKTAGDFNNNGLTDLLNYFVRDGFIDEQSSQNSYSFSEKYSNIGGKFWPVLARDVDNDGIVEIFNVSNDTTIEVWEVNSTLNLNKVATLTNFSPSGYGNDVINSPNGVISDIDADGTDEFWMIDQDGDLFGYKIAGNNVFDEQYLIQTGFLGSSAHLSTGDFDGDGKKELAVLLHSIDDLDIAPFYRFVVFNLSNNQVNFLLDKALIDASIEFNNTFRKSENSIRFADIDDDGSDELILFAFPYSYILKYDFNSYKIISYKENINSNSIFVGDLNNNGVTEIAFPTENGIEFIEFNTSTQAAKPIGLNGFNLTSSVIQLRWSGLAERYYIYKGSDPDSLILIDSLIFEPSYVDNFFNLNQTYYYAVRGYDPTKPIPLSGMSNIIEVYAHTPAVPVNAISNSSRSVIVTFSEKMKNTIDNLQSFNVIGLGYPNSISANNQYSYLLTYNSDFPAGDHQIIITDIKDFYGSPIENDTLIFTANQIPEIQSFYVSSFEIINSYKIKLTFNFPVDPNSAVNTGNYIFSPDNSVSSVQVDQEDSKTIYLDLTGNKPIGSIGREYVLRIENLVSDISSGGIRINSGAGSYLVLSTYANDLSNVFVYPNPTKENTEKITFANLPQRAKISIWSIDGKLIYEIEENDGNGGVDFNLTNFSGSRLSSGVYIYRVVQLDDMRNEGEEKLGKFAIVR